MRDLIALLGLPAIQVDFRRGFTISGWGCCIVLALAVKPGHLAAVIERLLP